MCYDMCDMYDCVTLSYSTWSWTKVTSTWYFASATIIPFRTRVLKEDASNSMLTDTMNGFASDKPPKVKLFDVSFLYIAMVCPWCENK